MRRAFRLAYMDLKLKNILNSLANMLSRKQREMAISNFNKNKVEKREIGGKF